VFSPDGSTLSVADDRGGVARLDVAAGREISAFVQELPRDKEGGLHPPLPQPGNTAFSTDGRLSIHFSIRGSALWDVSRGVRLRLLDERPTQAACFSPDGRLALVAITDRQSELYWYDVRDGGVQWINTGAYGPASALAVRPDLRVVVVGHSSGEIRALDLVDRRWLWEAKAEGVNVRCLAFTCDGQFLLSGSSGGTLSLWDAANGREIRKIARGEAPVADIALSANSQQILAIVGNGETSRFFDLTRATQLRNAVPEIIETSASTRQSPPDARAVERSAEWYALAGRFDWGMNLLHGIEQSQSERQGHEIVSLTSARCHWLGGDHERAAGIFEKLLDQEAAPEQKTYLTLCRDAARRGEP
jgi:WD40 repeat protein